MKEPYPFGSHVIVRTGDRHELNTAYLVDSSKVCGGGWRYRAVFPDVRGYPVAEAKVYSEEIETFLAVSEDETLRLLGLLR